MFKWQSYSHTYPIAEEDKQVPVPPGFTELHLRIDVPLWGDDLQFYKTWNRVDFHHSKYPEIHLALPVGLYSAEDLEEIYQEIQTTHTALFQTINDFFIRHGRVVVLLHPINSAFMKNDGNIYILESLVDTELAPSPDFQLNRTASLEHLNSESDEDSRSQSVYEDLLFSNSSYASSEDLFGIKGLNTHLDSVLSDMLKDCGLDGNMNTENWSDVTDSSSSKEDTDDIELVRQFCSKHSHLKSLF